ncbi:MAG: AbrB/MazE/SpoVT family DNA-binding domain-containing protein [Candidatus Heimdallarchaeota archaeon]|nr:AbrB/MazE/SpoVT family DNA-binding domain-containing protein [Candidatus Heimdallarchaeota archaeon]MCK4610424.1 AbrB/MazE/SpoVT family DNA-binding domain-containing protein [Candidatus Heimdallarchaeota archaeon]
MEKTYTVKARIHYGSKSLDLTIPADIVKERDIKPGDIFKIDIEETPKAVVITYTRIFENM